LYFEGLFFKSLLLETKDNIVSKIWSGSHVVKKHVDPPLASGLKLSIFNFKLEPEDVGAVDLKDSGYGRFLFNLI